MLSGMPFNSSPVIASTGNQAVDEGKTLQFNVTASDPDGDSVTLAASNLPAGAGLDPSTGVFAWTPGYGPGRGL